MLCEVGTAFRVPRYLLARRKLQTDGPTGGAPMGAPPAMHHAENELPQPQPPVALGFLNVKPEPWNDDT